VTSRLLVWFGWVLLLLLLAVQLVPGHLIIFRASWKPDPAVLSVLGTIPATIALVWYFRRPAEARPANFANRWVGVPLLLVAAAFTASTLVTSLSSGLLIPLGHGLIFGGRAPVMVEVQTNVNDGGRRKRWNCRDYLYLVDRDRLGRRICFQSAETRDSIAQQRPRAWVALSGWGSDRAILYWSAQPGAAPTNGSEPSQ
jgi:hypothetical protein